MEDQNQVLFRACGKAKADIECSTPVEAIFDDATCKLHMDIPPIRSYSKPRVGIFSSVEEFLPACDNWHFHTLKTKNGACISLHFNTPYRFICKKSKYGT